MEAFESDHCPVCNKTVIPNTNPEISNELREKLGDRIYTPGDDVKRIQLSEIEEQQREDIETFLREGDPPPLAVQESNGQ